MFHSGLCYHLTYGMLMWACDTLKNDVTHNNNIALESKSKILNFIKIKPKLAQNLILNLYSFFFFN